MGQTQKPKQVLGQGSLDPLFSTLLTIEGEAPDGFQLEALRGLLDKN